MTHNSREPRSPPLRTGASVLPPLSKFYYGPAQGWTSVEASPSHNGSTWSLNSPSEIPPSLPPRRSPAIPAYSPSVWQNYFPPSHEDPQGWDTGPAPSAPPASEFSSSYALTPGRSTSPVNPGWDSRPTSPAIDTSSWGVGYKRKHLENTNAGQKPLLPPRPSQSAGQASPPKDQACGKNSPHSKYSSQHPSARASATTIDVPLFLQPHTITAESAPPLPQRSSTPPRDHSVPLQSPPQLETLPPPPPKIPLDYEDDLPNQGRAPQRPKYDPQGTFDRRHQKEASQGSLTSSGSTKRPQLDPQKSHDDRSIHESWQNQGYQPPPQDQGECSPRSHNNQQPPSSPQYYYDDADRGQHDIQRLPQTSVSPNTEEGRIFNTSRWDSQAAYIPSLVPQQAVWAPHDRLSTSMGEASSTRPTTSTPESHQTSNTSYREDESHWRQSQQEQESNDSFYWHSGRSSSGDEEEKSDGTTSATPEASRNPAQAAAQYEPRGLPTRSTSLSPTPAVSYGASALGFGGPSDWEYFGDYEAEEVDDEELYIHKPRAELPAEYARRHSATPLLGTELHGFAPNTQEHECTLERPAGEQSGMQEQFNQQTEAKADEGSVLESKWSPSTTTPTTPRTNPSRPSTTTGPKPSEDPRPDLDEVVRAWSDAPYVGRPLEESVSQGLDAKDHEHFGNAAEASLASTPGEHVLGANAPIMDAPSRPRLPDAIDQSSLAQAVPIPLVTAPPDLDEERKRSPSIPIPQQLEEPPAHTRSKHRSNAETDSTSMESVQRLPDSLSITMHNTPTMREGNDPSAMGVAQKPYDHLAANANITSNSEQRSLLSSAKSVQQPFNRSAVPADDTRGSRNRHITPSADFARKRQGFDSPSEKVSSSVVFPRKSPKEAKTGIGNPSTTSSGLGTAVPPTSIPFKIRRNSLHESPQVPAGDLNIADFDGPGPSNESQRDLAVLSDNKSRLQTETMLQDVSNDSPSNPSKNTTPASSRRPSRLSPPQPSTDNLQAAEAITAEMNTQEVSQYLSKQSSSNALLPAKETPNPPNMPSDSPENTLSGEQERADNLEEECEQMPPQSVLEGKSRSQAQKDLARDKHIRDLRANETQQASTEAITKLEDSMSKTKDDVSQPTVSNSVSAIESSEEYRRSRFDQSTDPYADLDPWGRASLNRFAAMLREEARAESNKDKLNIFNVFTTRESRLRVVLYGTDDELILPPKPSNKNTTGVKSASPQEKLSGAVMKKPIPRTNPINVQQSAKALPPLPQKRDSMIGPPTSRLTPQVIGQSVDQITSGTHQTPSGEDPPTESPQFSPGGTPVAARHDSTRKHPEGDKAINSSGAELDTIFKNNGAVAGIPSSSIDELIPLGSKVGAEHHMTSHATSTTNEGRSEIKNYLTNRRSVYRPFATQTMESMEHAKNFGREPDFNIEERPIPAVSSLEGPFGSAASVEDRTENAVKGVVNQSPEDHLVQQSDLRRFIDADFDPLVMVLPESETVNNSALLLDLKKVMEAIPEDFSFIHESVVAWDAKSKVQRAENERQRHARQVKSEQRIDSLFDDHEIGYGDIAELESEFKRSEAARKVEEDREEYQTFVTEVFNIVWTRLHYELDQLIPHYERYSQMMNDTLAGKDMFDLTGEGLALAPSMNTFLALHQKLEIRYQKAFEAVLERDRRLKKIEISPWYTLSNITKVKQLERQFEDAEKKAIIEFCQQRDERANRLMDVLDHNTLRGVGTNQDYMEAIMRAVRRIASGRAFASIPSPDGPKRGTELVQKAKNITVLLATSSEQIVQTFHVADMLLNSADYEVSVAKAKVAQVDMATLAKLKEERTKEDQKLMRDLEHRLALIREDSRRTNDEIIKLMLFLGVQNGQAISTQPAPVTLGVQQLQQQATPGAKNREHETRMQRALDEAKKRNAAKEDGLADAIWSCEETDTIG